MCVLAGERGLAQRYAGSRWRDDARRQLTEGWEARSGAEIDDDDAAIARIGIIRIALRTLRTGTRRGERQLEERLGRVAPLAFFPLPYLLDNERRQHRSLLTTLSGAYAST